jgi:hypothetical protein
LAAHRARRSTTNAVRHLFYHQSIELRLLSRDLGCRAGCLFAHQMTRNSLASSAIMKTPMPASPA